MKLDSAEKVQDYLILEGLVNPDDKIQVQHLPGGVSCFVWKIIRNDDQWVLKQALDKLDVEADWYSDIERIHREHEVMKQLELIIPNASLPQVLHVDYKHHAYIMTFIRDAHETWKSHLMGGIFNPETAKSAALFIRNMHELSHNIDKEYKAEFQDQHYFVQLRIEAFHLQLIQIYPELHSHISKLIDELTLEKTCLVHGDFSPKNMLVKPEGQIVLLDFEVAHWGNPVFDIAYCLGHLILKAWHLNRAKEIFDLIKIFLDNYQMEHKNLKSHLGLMLLARMDGKSPVNYIQDPILKQKIRGVAFNWIKNIDPHLNLLDTIEKELIF